MRGLLLGLFLVPSLAHAEFAPFNHDVKCLSSSDHATSVTLNYDRTEFPDLGRQGGIHLEINTGISELSHMSGRMGIDPPYRRILRRAGAAGQVGNWIVQDANDPFVAELKLGFTTYDLIDDQGRVQDQFQSFISHVTLSRVREFGFHDGSTADTQEFIELTILDDFSTHHMRFKPIDCTLMN